MNYSHYIILFIFAFCTHQAFAQPNKPNQTNNNGDKIGLWQYKDSKGKIIYEGRYNEEGKKEGEWKFYISSVGRYTTEPDIIGTYQNGEKHGHWQYFESRSRNLLKGKFANNQIAGEWTYYDKKGQKLATGYFTPNFIRHGQWTIYYNNAPMAQGIYDYGLLSNLWLYDYYHEDSLVHIKGRFDYSQGQGNGNFEHYKVLRDPKFPTQESLVGHGTYSNGKKSGRWIEYSPGLKGEKIEIGHYDGTSQRTGLWETTINGKRSQDAYYNEGRLQGSFQSYYENGKHQYVSFYEGGMESGAFTSYYESGKIKEKGFYTIANQEFIEDTIYYKIELPYEFNFMLIDSVDLETFNYNAISWMNDMHYNLSESTLYSHWKEALIYAKTGVLKIDKINKKYKHSVRTGEYKSFYESGNLHLEGNYQPFFYIQKTGTNSTTRSFARDGEWKEYDDLGYLKKIYYFNAGKLEKVTDDNGNELSLEENFLK